MKARDQILTTPPLSFLYGFLDCIVGILVNGAFQIDLLINLMYSPTQWQVLFSHTVAAFLS